MIYDNKKIMIFFSAVIILLVAVLALFDFGLPVRAFLGTVILGLIVFARALISAEIVPPEMDLDTDDLGEEHDQAAIDSATSDSCTDSRKEHDENQSTEHIKE